MNIMSGGGYCFLLKFRIGRETASKMIVSSVSRANISIKDGVQCQTHLNASASDSFDEIVTWFENSNSIGSIGSSRKASSEYTGACSFLLKFDCC